MKFAPAAVIDMYDDWASRYDKEFKGNGWCGPKFVHNALAAEFNLAAQPLRVLDVGIGTGLLSAHFKRANPECHITGVDISGEMLAKCRNKGLADHLIQRDFQKDGLPFGKESFDVVVSSGVFELLDKPQKVIKEMGRVLHEDGAFAFTVYSDSPRPYDCLRHPDEAIMGALDEAKLEVNDIKRFWAFNHYNNDIYYHLYTGIKAPSR